MLTQITDKDVKQFVLRQFSSLDTEDVKKLVKFHTVNKYLLMAHSQEELRVLGKLVANLKGKPKDAILKEYENHLKVALSKEPTLKTNTNVLSKIYAHFRKKLSQDEKDYLLNAIEDFRNQKISLGEILNIVKDFTIKYENTYLARQTFYLLYSDIERGFTQKSSLYN